MDRQKLVGTTFFPHEKARRSVIPLQALLQKHTATMNNSTSISSPFGVKLKSTGRSPERERRTIQSDATTKKSWRQKLRKVPGPSPSVRRVVNRPQKSNRHKLVRPVTNEPFTLMGGFGDTRPLFGVVLRSRTPTATAAATPAALHRSEEVEDPQGEEPQEESQEEFLDLNISTQVQQENESSSSEGDKNSPYQPFGVRLKPTFRPYDQHGLRRVYQIDLNPPPLNPEDNNKNMYRSQSRSFLEIKMRHVERKNGADNNNGADMAQFQLRHMVAPADGGPQRAVTEATFQVPLLRKVPKVGRTSSTRKDDPLKELLQLTLQNLRHVTPKEYEPSEPTQLQFRLRHVNVDTQQTHEMDQVIHVTLDPVHKDQTAKNGATTSPSMQVELKPVDRNNDDGESAGSVAPEFANIQLDPVRCCSQDEEEEDEDKEDADDDDCEEAGYNSTEEEEEEISEKEETLEEEKEEISEEETISEEENEASEGDDNGDTETRESNDPEDLVAAVAAETNAEENAVESQSPAAVTSDTTAPLANDTETVPPENRDPPRRRALHRQRSRSLTEIRVVRTESSSEELSGTRRRDLLMWYNRMKTPNREEMKRRVAKLPSSCDITPDDVDLLPWRCNGKYLDVRIMTKYFMDDWQGAENH